MIHHQCVAVTLPFPGGVGLLLRGGFLLRGFRSQLCQTASGFDLPDGAADGSFGLVRVHRLQQIVAGTQMHRFVGVLEQAVCRDKDHLALRALFQHGAGCIQTVHTGHLNVHQDQVCAPQHRRIRCLAAVHARHLDVHQNQVCTPEHGGIGGFASVFRHFHCYLMLEPAHDDIRQRFPFHLLVIRDQQTNHSSNSSSFSTSGRYRITAVPRPGRERTTTRQRASSSRKRAATL